SLCEPLEVTALTPLVSTEIRDANNAPVGATTTAGTTVHDRATVSGTGPTPTGTVNFTFYTSLDCSSGGVTQSNVTLSAGIADSSAHGPLATGSYSFKVHYNGDTFYGQTDSLCEPLEVTALTPLVSTEIQIGRASWRGGTTTAGTTVHDRATVSGTGPTPTGTVNFTFYTSLDCGSGGVTQSNVALAAGIADSSAHGPLATGSYSFKVHYNGDTFYGQTDSLCEPLEVTALTPLVSTEIRDANNAPVGVTTTAGTTVHDRATVSGTGPTPTGTVNFTFYTSLDCGSGGVTQSNVALAAGIADSSAHGPLATGSYSFKVHYNGDTFFSLHDALPIPLEVTALTPLVSTEIRDANNAPVGVTTTAG